MCVYGELVWVWDLRWVIDLSSITNGDSSSYCRSYRTDIPTSSHFSGASNKISFSHFDAEPSIGFRLEVEASV